VSGAGDNAWVAQLALQPHPEGGYFKRIYTATPHLPGERGERALATSILYLLDRAQPRGCLHRNRSDILHFLLDGGPLEYLVVENGMLRREILGGAGARFLLVRGGCWKASRLVGAAAHGLIAEVVVPGFDYADHEFATAETIRRELPALFGELESAIR
jgi:predicted cupin superfamily sugar epimerase